jgi:hypothetical protein
MPTFGRLDPRVAASLVVLVVEGGWSRIAVGEGYRRGGFEVVVDCMEEHHMAVASCIVAVRQNFEEGAHRTALVADTVAEDSHASPLHSLRLMRVRIPDQ